MARAVQGGTSLPVHITGSDADAGLPVVMSGGGTAGSPSGGVQSVQGVSGGTVVPVTQTGALPAGTNNIGDVDVASIAAGETHLGEVGSRTIVAAATTMTRPGDTATYATGDLVANSTTAGSVVPLSFTVGRIAAGSGAIRRCRIRKSSTGVVNAFFRLHLYGASPTVTNGDNAAWLSNNVATYLGAMDVLVDRVFSDGAAGNGVPINGSEINFVLASGQVIFGLLEARGAYVPGNAETIDVSLEVMAS